MYATMLTTLEAQSASHDQRQRQRAAELYQQGHAQLRQALSQNLRAGHLLESARQAFLKANRLAPDWPEPYLGLSYLLILFQAWQQASTCLQSLLSLAPTHAEALELADFVQAKLAAGQTRTERPDLGAEALIQQIQAQVKAVLEAEPLGISPVPEHIEAIEARHDWISDRHQRFLTAIQTLSQDEDPLALNVALRPLEVCLRRVRQVLEASRAQRQLAQALITLEQEARLAMPRLAGLSEAARRSLLDDLLDRCDLLADALDAREGKEDISELYRLYKQLMTSLEYLQDLFEEIP